MGIQREARKECIHCCMGGFVDDSCQKIFSLCLIRAYVWSNMHRVNNINSGAWKFGQAIFHQFVSCTTESTST